MKKKGFTLIELLAVIVILAVIALIATPAVLNIIEDSRRSAAEASTRNIANAAKTYYATKLIGNSSINQIDITDGTLKYSGEQATKGKVFFDNEGNTYLKLYINGYCVERNYNGVVSSGKVEESECEIPEVAPESDIEKKIGDVVYYNPTLNDYCTDYAEANSYYNQSEGCLKWYVYGINGSEYNVILDHTLSVAADYSSNESIFSDFINNYMKGERGWTIDIYAPSPEELIKLTKYYEELENKENLATNYDMYMNDYFDGIWDKKEGLVYSGYGFLYVDDDKKETALEGITLIETEYQNLLLPKFIYEDLIDNCDANMNCYGSVFRLEDSNSEIGHMNAVNYFGVVQSFFAGGKDNDLNPFKPVMKLSK